MSFIDLDHLLPIHCTIEEAEAILDKYTEDAMLIEAQLANWQSKTWADGRPMSQADKEEWRGRTIRAHSIRKIAIRRLKKQIHQMRQTVNQGPLGPVIPENLVNHLYSLIQRHKAKMILSEEDTHILDAAQAYLYQQRRIRVRA